jgi:ABC-2 type transport system permease protein
MISGIPVIQLMLFGFAINTDPKHLPPRCCPPIPAQWSRSLLAAMQNSGYFRIERTLQNEAQLERALALGDVQFAITIPENFGRKLVRGRAAGAARRADATDPGRGRSRARSARADQPAVARQRDLKGALADLAPVAPAMEMRVHRATTPRR